MGLLVVAATAMSLRAQAVPSSPAALVKHGNELSRQEKWKEALDFYQRALAIRRKLCEQEKGRESLRRLSHR